MEDWREGVTVRHESKRLIFRGDSGEHTALACGGASVIVVFLALRRLMKN